MNINFIMLEAAASATDVMSFSDRASEALQVSLLGMATVFAVLAILWGVLEIFRFFFYDLPNKSKKREEKSEAPKAPKAPKTPVAPVAPVVQAATSDEEIVAAITAAISVVMDRPASSFRVVSFRKTGTR